MNLIGIVIPGDRVPAVPGKQIQYRNGSVHTTEAPTSPLDPLGDLTPPPPPALTPDPTPDLGLFQ
jgi:ATP-dependent Lhr-like helicase